ncbi:Hypothetical protein CINCED_3A010510 [Cinara cedri]|uniref:Uncharacterized protein n=1 Tax=Cinara cedri TaxID=506608 RepID=A0A5E4NH80_9HEMI|nr:Hypothetical protein CINCED_3A010510 [Cinara cedri]
MYSSKRTTEQQGRAVNKWRKKKTQPRPPPGAKPSSSARPPPLLPWHVPPSPRPAPTSPRLTPSTASVPRRPPAPEPSADDGRTPIPARRVKNLTTGKYGKIDGPTAGRGMDSPRTYLLLFDEHGALVGK